MSKNRRPSKLNAAMFIVLILALLSVTAQAASFSRKAPEPTAKLKKKSVVISWKKRSDLTGYEIFQCNAKGKKRELLKVTKSRRVTFKNLEEGKTYYYRVRGYLKKKKNIKYTSYSKVIKVQVYRKSTLKKLLLTALQPVGSTMYVWGGGWDEDDVGAGIDARTIGVSKKWKKFFKKQKSSYNYRNTRYQIHDGLDCSGYIGWCIYNILETENGKPGYVLFAQQMAQNYAARGWGSYTPAGKMNNYRPGDIMSTASGHVWMTVGQCSDGSVVILHSSPPGVQLMGTPTPSGKEDSKAVALAEKYMKKYFPDWYKKFPNCSRGMSYLTDYSRMRWDLSGNIVMSDPENYRNKTAEQVLKDLFRSR